MVWALGVLREEVEGGRLKLWGVREAPTFYLLCLRTLQVGLGKVLLLPF